MAAIALGGPTLHAGGTSAITVAAHPGPITLWQRGHEALLHDLPITRTDQGVAIGNNQIHVDLVEHLCAAIGGLGISHNLRVGVFGSEIPLLDGAALRFSRALMQLHIPISDRHWHITHSATLEFGSSSYRFTPCDETRLTVRIDFDHPLIVEQQATWDGSRSDFIRRIASARTFGFRRDVDRLRAAGRAKYVDPSSVVVLDDDGTSPSDPAPDECARHKLLDLIGDLTLAGGVPRGIIEATRPGHRATHAILGMARARGVVGNRICHREHREHRGF